MDEYSQEMPDYEGEVFSSVEELIKELNTPPIKKRSVHDANYRLTHKEQRREYMKAYMANRRKNVPLP